MRHFYHINLLMYCLGIFLTACGTQADKRQVVNLNGIWEIEKTDGELPFHFSATVQVPGLVDLATPAIDTLQAMYQDGWYWHKSSFELKETDFEKIELKIHKAKYHTKVYVNGQYAGENLYCFTPSYFDIKPYLNPAGQPNELLIGVGCKDQLPDTIPDGHDYEKLKYIPGIYDKVEIILANRPYIRNIQCVPDVINGRLRVVAELETERAGGIPLEYEVTEVISREAFRKGSLTVDGTPVPEEGIVKVDFEIDMKGSNLWSPESPFLYELLVKTEGDDKRTRFGMRSFRIDPERKIALLNEKPYYIKGTNVCIFRFFEDPQRGSLPWDAEWPIQLHQQFKRMNWHMMRYCIGFPPERWYEICDSLGFMLQDEYPIWYLKEKVKSPQIAEEYKRWMRERWNHPSVVIWDAQNELVTEETGKAIRQVRELDLSDRPWENGWSRPERATDPSESHPYLFIKYMEEGVQEPPEGYKKELFGHAIRPMNDANQRYFEVHKDEKGSFDNPSLINEYGWIWLNRDGSTTTLTDRVYDVLWDGKSLTPEQRIEIYSRHLAMLTEYWRAHRQAFGILHFCGLGYSRPEEPRGQTSDHWIDLVNLRYQPSFYKYVRPSFAPVGLMIDLWEKSYKAGTKLSVPVYVINDLDKPFAQEVRLEWLKEGGAIQTLALPVEVAPYEVKIISFDTSVPNGNGDFQLRAVYGTGEDEVFSLRDIPVKE